MGVFSQKPMGGGMMDVIRCDEPSYLVWKWHPQGTEAGNNRKENAIRWGSSLRVKEGSVAVFVYSQKDGTKQDYIEGPFDDVIKTSNFPILSSIIGIAYDGGSPFQAEVYFINLAQIIQIKFAVPYFDVYDPRFLDFGVPTAVRGTISFKISDYKEFIKLHRLDTFSLNDFQNQVKDAVIKYVKTTVANAPDEQKIPVVQLERKIELINEIVESKVKQRFLDEFGVTVSSIDIAVIDIDKTSDGYQQLKAVTQDLTTATMQAQTEVNIKEMRDTQALGVYERAERIKANVEEDQYARHKETQSSHFTTYQLEAAENVGVAGAQGLGMMGNGGSGSGGFNPAAMMAGMAIGGALGQNVAGTMNTMMNGINSQAGMTPPPVPSSLYNVAVNGQATGPFDITTLSQMASSGSFSKDSLVWKKGMAEWVKADSIDELQALFVVSSSSEDMPPIPN